MEQERLEALLIIPVVKRQGRIQWEDLGIYPPPPPPHVFGSENYEKYKENT